MGPRISRTRPLRSSGGGATACVAEPWLAPLLDLNALILSHKLYSLASPPSLAKLELRFPGVRSSPAIGSDARQTHSPRGRPGKLLRPARRRGCIEQAHAVGNRVE